MGVVAETLYGAKSLVKGLGVTLKNFIRPKVTLRYGEDQNDGSWFKHRFRGLHGLTCDPHETYDDGSPVENCIGCMACAKVCPDDLIAMTLEKKEGHKGRYPVTFQIDVNPCCFCGLCSEVCPTPYKALILSRDFELATTDRADLILTKEKLMYYGEREMERFRREEQAHQGEVSLMELTYKGYAGSEAKSDKRAASFQRKEEKTEG